MKTKIAGRRCRECGKGTIHPVAKAGRRERFKTLELEIPADLKIPTCNKCGAEWMDRITARAIDVALDGVYRETLKTMWDSAIGAIKAETSMKRLEQLLGLSDGYISKVSNGRSDPSAELVGHLSLIARDVKGRTHELEKLWADAPRIPRRRHESRPG